MDHISDDESGLGLIEIVVAMFMLALIAIAFLPFLISSFGMTRSNTTLATATQLLDQQFDQLRQLPTTDCAALTAFRDRDDAALDRVVDSSRNVTLTVDRTFSCPTNTTESGSETMTIAVIESGTDAVIAEASTIVYVAP